MKESIPKAWRKILEEEISMPYFHELCLFLERERSKKDIFPPKNKVFAALSFFAPEETKIVILGQDPYHTLGMATGLAFSVPKEIKIPPSLRNIFKEIASDIGTEKDQLDGDLSRWAEQGVLLLNTILSVESGLPASHKNIGWENVTDRILNKISSENRKVIFVGLGKFAQNKIEKLNLENHHYIKTSHPSPLSAYRGFLGSKIFSKINSILEKENKKTITW